MHILRTRKFYAILTAVALIAVASLSMAGAAPFSNPLPLKHSYVYSVKFICNPLNPSDALGLGLAAGAYYTDINVHNPSYAKVNATITQKLVVALPEPAYAPIGSPTPYSPAMPNPYLLGTVKLGADGAMRLDCTYIMNLLTGPGGLVGYTYAKGFLVLYSNIKLDVVAEYTVAPTPAPGAPVYIETQIIQPQSFMP